MSEGARIEAIDSLRLFRVALIKFMEGASAALNDAESEMNQTMNWLEHEQYSYWQNQIRKRQELVGRCKEAVRMKKLFKDSAGRAQSAVDEEKALRVAVARHEEAELKFANTRKYARVLQKEIESYKGNAQRFATTLNSDLPRAAAMLDQFMAALEAYVAYSPADAPTNAPPAADQGRKRRLRINPEAPMGVYEGRGNLAKALKTLETRWLEAKESWDDPRSREFEQRFLQPLELDLRSAVSAMDQMAVVISRIHQECE